MVTLEKIVTMFKEDWDERRKIYENMESTVGQKLDDITKEQGHITRPMEEKLFKNLSDKIQKKIDDKKYSTLARIPTNNSDLQDYEQSNSLNLVTDVSNKDDVNFQIFHTMVDFGIFHKILSFCLM